MPNPKLWVPCPESRNTKPGTQDLIFETGHRYLSKMWKSNFFDLLKFLSPSAKCQTLSAMYQVLKFRTRNLELGTQNSGLGTWYLRLDKEIYQKCENEIFLIFLNFCPKCQVPNPECCVPSPDTQNSELGTRNSELRTQKLELRTQDSEVGTWDLIFETGQRYLSKMCKSNFCPKCQVLNPELRVPNFGTRHPALGVRGSVFGTLGQKLEEIKNIWFSHFSSSLKYQVLSPEFWVLSSESRVPKFGTRNLGVGVRHLALGTKIWFTHFW
jgi:hypothetical protein